MTKPLLGTCDNCGNVTTIKYIKKLHPKGIQETYFKCVVCNEHYTCFVTDNKVREMQKEMKRIRSKGKNLEVLPGMQEQVNNRMNQLKQDILNNT